MHAQPDKFLPGPPLALSRQEFVETFGGVYEHSPWVAERVFDKGLAGGQNQAGGLSKRMTEIVNQASNEEKLALIRAHPDLVGKSAIAELTAASRREQNNAGLDQCTAAEFTEFQQLNRDYKNKFGFPFILAVSGYHRKQILDAFRQRLNNAKNTEFQAAMEQIHRIALRRLQAME